MYRLVLILFGALFSVNCYAGDAQVIGDWRVLESHGDGLAYTAGDGRNLALAFRCFASDKRCLHLLVADIRCNSGQRYPILINTDGGAEMTVGICALNKKIGKHELYLTGYEKIHNILKSNNVIGFAIPLESGAFKAVRFSLKGSARAMDKAEEIAARSSSGRQQEPQQAPQKGASYF